MNDIKGFTLAELLIIIAIIAILVMIAIPIFTAQLERARETTDLANVRSGYMELVVDGALEGRNKVVLIPLKQKVENWQLNTNTLNIAGIAPNNINWIGVPKAQGNCKLEYIAQTNSLIINWNGGGNTAYLTAILNYQYQGLMQLKLQNNNDRVAADQATLKALGEEILNQGWTLAELKNKLGILVQGGAIRIADYFQDKNGSFDGTYNSNGFRINSNSMLLTLLNNIGYDGGPTSTNSSGDIIYTNSLFYSDELATNKFKDYPINQTKRSIIIDNVKTDSSGKIIGLNIYTKAMDDQANMNNAEKAKFNIRIGE